MDIANSACLDQTPKNAAYDQDFHSLHTGTCISIRNKKTNECTNDLCNNDQCSLSLNMKALPVSLTIPSCSSLRYTAEHLNIDNSFVTK